jgi:hypothetical protein
VLPGRKPAGSFSFPRRGAARRGADSPSFIAVLNEEEDNEEYLEEEEEYDVSRAPS